MTGLLLDAVWAGCAVAELWLVVLLAAVDVAAAVGALALDEGVLDDAGVEELHAWSIGVTTARAPNDTSSRRRVIGTVDISTSNLRILSFWPFEEGYPLMPERTTPWIK